MDFKLVNAIVGNIIKTIENTAVASVRSIKSGVFSVVVKNQPEVQKISGSVSVNNQQKFPKTISVSNFPKQAEFPKEIRISNFPKQTDFPKEMAISNQPLEEIAALKRGLEKIVSAIEEIELSPIIKVDAPKQEKVVVPPASVTVKQQEVDYKKIATLLADSVKDYIKTLNPQEIDYSKLEKIFNKEIVVSGGGSKPMFSTPDGKTYKALVDSERRILVGNVDPLAVYQATDADTSNSVKYYGFTDKDENWYILRDDSGSSYRYAKGSGNYTTAWSGRAGLDYGYFYEVF